MLVVMNNSVDVGGYKEIVVEIKGDDVYSSFKWEVGVYCV